MLNIFSSLLKWCWGLWIPKQSKRGKMEMKTWNTAIEIRRERGRIHPLCYREFPGRVPSLEKPPTINLNYKSSLVFTGEGDNITANLLCSHSNISRSVLLQLSTAAKQGQPKKETETEHCFMWRKSSCYPWLSQLTDNRLIHFEVCKGLQY